MNSRKFLFPAFIAVALIQLYVPVSMIWEREVILTEGKEFRFMTAPIDPSDPFRGKYVILSYRDEVVEVDDGNEWMAGEEIYAVLATDADGFAIVQSAMKEKPTGDLDFVKVRVRSVNGGKPASLFIEYPFDRFYMEESKAHEAEQVYIESQADTTSETYALVGIRNGDAVLKDVLVNGISIRDIARQRHISTPK
jgi:uncharacterized membrane-anchored protein